MVNTMTQNQSQISKTLNGSIIFVEKVITWDGYELIDDEYTVTQPVQLIHGNPWGKYKR